MEIYEKQFSFIIVQLIYAHKNLVALI